MRDVFQLFIHGKLDEKIKAYGKLAGIEIPLLA